MPGFPIPYALVTPLRAPTAHPKAPPPMNAPERPPTTKPSFKWDDPLLLDQQLDEDERMVLNTAHAYAQEKLAPDSKVPFHLPHRLAAARAGLGTFGKNC